MPTNWEDQKAQIAELATQLDGVEFEDDGEGKFRLSYPDHPGYFGMNPVGMGDIDQLGKEDFEKQISNLEEIKERQEEKAKRKREADGPEDILYPDENEDSDE